MAIKGKFASHPSMVLTGVSLVILMVLLVAAFTASIERAAGRSVFTLQVAPVYAATPDDQGQAIFKQKCQGCHTIGGGQIVGPDLKGITSRRDRDWLISFIVSPEQLIGQGDALAKQLVEEYGGTLMPNMGLSEPEAKDVLLYIEAQSGNEPSTPPPEQDAEKVAAVPIGDASIGRDIFVGKTPLQNGGAACISCHNIRGIGALGGGTMGKDLTTAYFAFGEQGLTSILTTAPFPMMEEIYTKQPLTDDEIAHLLVFLGEASGSADITPSQNPLTFIIVGGVGLLIIIGIFQLIWRGRLSGVRQSLVKGGSK